MFDWANKAIFDDKPKVKSVPYVLDKIYLQHLVTIPIASTPMNPPMNNW